MSLENFLLENIPGLTKEMLDGTLKSRYKNEKWFQKRLPQGIIDISTMSSPSHIKLGDLREIIPDIGDIIDFITGDMIVLDFEILTEKIPVRVKDVKLFPNKHNNIGYIEQLEYYIKWKYIQISRGFDLSILKQWKRDNILEDILN